MNEKENFPKNNEDDLKYNIIIEADGDGAWILDFFNKSCELRVTGCELKTQKAKKRNDDGGKG